MQDVIAGSFNLAQFVAATAGSKGSVAAVRGGWAVAGPIDIANGYVNMAVRTDPDVAPGHLLDDVDAFFQQVGHSYVVWAPVSDQALISEIGARGGQPDKAEPSPAMAIRTAIDHSSRFTCRPVRTEADIATFTDFAERGYAIAGFGWMLREYDCWNSPHMVWAIACDASEEVREDVSVAVGFACETTGGIYNVATPPEFRGRGGAAAVTTWVTNELFSRGVSAVTLQASQAGFPIYERLGFETYDYYARFALSPRVAGTDR